MINNINLKFYRKFENLDLNINKNLVIFIGPNASGKTSVLESIYLISRCKSHRTNEFDNLIENNKDYSIINIRNNHDIYKMIISKKGKKIFKNNVEYEKTSDFVGNIKTVLFSPNDLNLIYGSKTIRRNFLDIEISMIDKKYLIEIKKYKKLIKERNEILKNYNDSNKLLLDVITKQLIESSKIIYDYRNKFINDLNKYLEKIHYDLYNEKIKICYDPNVNIDDLENIYKSKLNYDILTKMTNYGIHRDDLIFYINDKNAIEYSSQGQIRSIILSLKISLFYYLKKYFNEDVILLLDDIFSELDEERQNNIVKFLLSNNQTFITTTNIDLIPNKLKELAQIINFKKE